MIRCMNNFKAQSRPPLGLGLIFGLLALAGCPSQSGTQMSASPAATNTNTTAATPGLQGSVYGGRQPIAGATVLVYEMSAVSDNPPTQIGSTTTDSSGNFTVTFSPTPANGQIVYLVADGGDAGSGTNSAISLMTVAGPYCSGTGCSFPLSVNIDELSTVVSTAAMSGELDLQPCSNITGNTQPTTDLCVELFGDNTISTLFAAQVSTLVNLVSGQASGFLTSQATSSPIHLTLEKANSLADILATCVNSSGPTSSACAGLFGATLNNASDTLTAAYDIATSPVINANGAALFSLLPSTPVYAPVVTAAPANWVIAGNIFSYAANYGTGTSHGSVSAWLVSHQKGVSVLPITTGGAGSCGDTTDPGNCFAAGEGPSSVVITPGGEFVYADNATSGNISAWGADPATGALVAIGASSCGSGLPSNCFTDGHSPQTLALNSAGTFLYAVDSSNNISVYSINSSTGALTPITGSPFAAGNTPAHIVLDTTGNFAYVSNYNGNDVSAYTVDPAHGTLTPVPAGPCSVTSDPNNCYDAGPQPEGLVIDSTGSYLYAANSNCGSSNPCSPSGPGSVSQWSINSSSGALTQIAASPCGAGLASNCVAAGNGPFDVAEVSGAYLYAANAEGSDLSSYSVNSSTGALTSLTANPCGVSPDPDNCFATGTKPAGLVGAPNTLIVVNSGSNQLSIYTVKSSTGALTASSLLSTYNADVNSQGISIDPTGRYAYVTNGSGTIDLFGVNPLSGGLRSNNSVSSPNAVGSNMAIDPSGRYLYSPGGGGGNQVAAFSIGPADGYLNVVPAGSCGSGNNNNNCFPAGPNPETVSVDASGKFLYAANFNCASNPCSNPGSISAYTIDSTSGALTAVTTGAASCGDATDPMNCFAAGEATLWVAADPAAGLLYATNAFSNNISAFTINSSGALSNVAGSSCGSGLPTNCFAAGTPANIVFTPSGAYAYAVNNGANSITAFSVNSSTGVLTPISGSPFAAGNEPFAGAVTPNGEYYYVANNNGGDVSVYSINSSTGVLTPVTTGGAGPCGVASDPDNCFAAGTQPQSVAVYPTGQYVYVVNRNCSPTCSNPGSVMVYLLNNGNGALTPISSTSPFAAGYAPYAVVFGP